MVTITFSSNTNLQPNDGVRETTQPKSTQFSFPIKQLALYPDRGPAQIIHHDPSKKSHLTPSAQPPLDTHPSCSTQSSPFKQTPVSQQTSSFNRRISRN